MADTPANTTNSDTKQTQKSFGQQLKEATVSGLYSGLGIKRSDPNKPMKEQMKDSLLDSLYGGLGIKKTSTDKQLEEKNPSDASKVTTPKENAKNISRINRKVDNLVIHTKRNYSEILQLKRRLSIVENKLDLLESLSKDSMTLTGMSPSKNQAGSGGSLLDLLPDFFGKGKGRPTPKTSQQKPTPKSPRTTPTPKSLPKGATGAISAAASTARFAAGAGGAILFMLELNTIIQQIKDAYYFDTPEKQKEYEKAIEKIQGDASKELEKLEKEFDSAETTEQRRKVTLRKQEIISDAQDRILSWRDKRIEELSKGQSSEGSQRLLEQGARRGPTSLTLEERKAFLALPDDVKRKFQSNPSAWKDAGKPGSMQQEVGATPVQQIQSSLPTSTRVDGEKEKTLTFDNVNLKTTGLINYESTDKIILNAKVIEIKSIGGKIKFDAPEIEFVQQNYVLTESGFKSTGGGGKGGEGGATPSGEPSPMTPGGRGQGSGMSIPGISPMSGRRRDSSSPQMSAEARVAFDALRAGTLSIDDPKASVLKNLSPEQLSSMGVQKTEGGFSMTPSQAASRVAGMSDEDIAKSIQKSGKLKSGNFQQQTPMLMNRLMSDFNLTKEQAAGVVGNLAHESAGLQAGIQEKKPISGRGGLGWAQWTGSRRRDFEAYLERTGQSATDPEANYGFLKEELQGKERRSLEKLRTARTAEEATHIFERSYERAGIKHDQSRMNYARQAMGLFNPEAGTGSGSAEPITPESIARERQRLTQQEQARESSQRQSAWNRNLAGQPSAMPSSPQGSVDGAITPSPALPTSITPAAAREAGTRTSTALGAFRDRQYGAANLSELTSVGAQVAGIGQISAGGPRGQGSLRGLCGKGTRGVTGALLNDSYFAKGLGGNAESLSRGNRYLQKSGLYDEPMALGKDQMSKKYLDSLPIGTVISSTGGGKGYGHVQVKGPNGTWISDGVQTKVLTNNYSNFVAHLPNERGLQRLNPNVVNGDPSTFAYMQQRNMNPQVPTPEQIANGVPGPGPRPTPEQVQQNQNQIAQAALRESGSGVTTSNEERGKILANLRAGLPDSASPAVKAARESLLQAESTLRMMDPSNKMLPENQPGFAQSETTRIEAESAVPGFEGESGKLLQNTLGDMRAAEAVRAATDTGSDAALGAGEGGENLNVTSEEENKIQRQYEAQRSSADENLGYAGEAGKAFADATKVATQMPTQSGPLTEESFKQLMGGFESDYKQKEEARLQEVDRSSSFAASTTFGAMQDQSASAERIESEIGRANLEAAQQGEIRQREREVEQARDTAVGSVSPPAGGPMPSTGNDPEALAASPGNNGYGSKKESGDMPSICTI